MPTTDVTVVVPTHSRPASLTRLLAGLVDQVGDALSCEVVVVDNDGSGAAAAVVGMPAFRSLHARVVAEATPGAAAARNRGIDAAEGALIAFLDDDVTPEEGWLAGLTAPLIEGAAGAGGRVLLDPDVAIPRWVGDGLRPYLAEHDLGATPRRLAAGEYVLSANAAFRRDVLLEVGGFDERLGPRKRAALFNDDVDLSARVREVGELRWAPSAVVVHEVRPERITPRYLLRRQFDQGRSDALLHRGRVAEGISFAFARAARTAWPSVARGLYRPGSAFAIAGEAARAAGFVVERIRA
ncbi:MAG: glycosyltransferase family 2 protein [Acidimicrobiia bacterium]